MLIASGYVGGGSAFLEYLGAFTGQGAGGPGYTFTGITLAKAGLLILTVNGDMNTSGRTFSGLTIGGNAATVDSNHHGDQTGVGTSIAAIVSRVIAAGATGNIVATFSNTMTGCSLEAYLLTRYQSVSRNTTAGNATGGTGATSISTTIDIPSRGVLIVTASCVQTSIALAGVDTDNAQVVNSIYQFASGSDQRLAAATAHAVSSSKGGAATSYAIAAATWQ